NSSFVYASPAINVGPFLNALSREIQLSGASHVYPMSDFTTVPISEQRGRLGKNPKLPLPSKKSIRISQDKLESMELAQQLKIPCPKTYNIEDLREPIKAKLIVKSRKKIFWKDGRALMVKVSPSSYVSSLASLKTEYEKIDRLISPPLVQEAVPGTGYGVEALFNHGELRALFTHRRIREYPVSGGASTLRVSTKNELMEKYAVSLLTNLEWHGLAMVEFKLDSRDNAPKFIEINGRPWGSIQLAISSGVDFPSLLYKMLEDGDVSPVFGYELGVKCRWLLPGDALNFYSRLLHYPGKLSAVRDFLTPNRNDDILSFSDPLPTFGALAGTLENALEVLTGKRSQYGDIR
ncbi:MAG: ATP-grasp domain-containing protein, partial [Candidatus Micrarchaeota archaeon]